MRRPAASGRELGTMAEISRALTLGHIDRAFVLLTETVCSSTVAAAFLLESGVEIAELPREAKRAIVEAAALAA